MKSGYSILAATSGLVFSLFGFEARGTTINFDDSTETLQVFIDGAKASVGPDPGLLALAPDNARTTVFDTFCLFCTTGIRGVVLFEPGTSEASDFIIALPLFGGFPFEIFTQFFFESDPDLLFFANNSPFVAMEAQLFNSLTAKALSGQIPKIDETGKLQVLFDASKNINLFRDLNGAVADLDSSFVISAISDTEVPEPSILLLVAALAIVALLTASRGRMVASRR